MDLKNWKHWAVFAVGVLVVVAVAMRVPFISGLVFGTPAASTTTAAK